MYIDRSPEAQRLRSQLRISYLRGLAYMSNKSAVFHLYKTPELTGKMKGADPTNRYFCVKDLKTPVELVPHAYLRTSDLISVTIKDIAQDK